ncbi:uncharacterized protein LOC6577048 [Drosophila mojavensis]|uniref:F-box domain-containing protein n=1 Tax=Drosophila mojavensis TaxID=7230 RepID=B4KIV9_DROMO|nr:uncharacterized protein LOC6577048 [Drosophila mojavensis]XP_043864823.1 uncharacterized protein LOC6577048 [Drosophila mojavensis]EDW12465.1 uncharacterized protein Dmoj_GI17693 [Drosophila mojavensis]
MTTTGETEPRPRSSSLLQLNDDVLALIVAQLSVYQQFELSQLHSRLRSIVQALWRTRVRNVALQDELLGRASSRQFQAFMLALAPHLERLSCHQLDVRRLRLLSDHCLPHVISLEWLGVAQQPRRGRVRFVDEDVRLLKRVFPSLRKLKLRGCQVTGKYLHELELLTELCLDDCQYLESQYFRDIFRLLKLRKFDIMEDCDEVNCCDLVDVQLCPTLEHIKIADYHLCMESDITQQLLRLPHLSKLSIYSKNFVFDVLERIARPSNAAAAGIKQIEGFRFSGLLHDYGRLFRELSHLRHLRRLEVHGQSEEGQLQCLSDQALCQLAAQLPELSELHLCGYQLESPAGILQFVINCRQLRILDMTRSRCIGNAFVGRCQAVLAKQSWRTQPLELWIRQSDIVLNLLQNFRYLRIDTKRMTPNMDYMSSVLKFSFVR